MTTPMILRLPRVKATTGLSRSTIHLEWPRATFPKPVSYRVGGRLAGWRRR